ncbi:Serine/threonine phosphatase stp [bacterium HR10]|nr:Serine/threonine phosphatase stp [bacterium HR10]
MSRMIDEQRVIVTWHARTDVGLVRPNNEDNFLILDVERGAYWTAADGACVPDGVGRWEIGPSGIVLAVSDGMGGALAGEVASHLAVTTVARLLHRFDARALYAHLPFSERLRLALEQANRLIYEKSQEHPELMGMGATFTAAAYHQGWLYLGQVGDSRAYMIRAGRIRQLTKDQSLVHHLVEAGFLTEEQAERHAYRNVILQALGAHPHTVIVMDRVQVRRGDHVLLCSDGLSGKVTAPEMCEIILGASDLVEATNALVQLAVERGGEDNITVLLARFDGDALPQAREDEEPAPLHIERDDRLPEVVEPELWDELVRFVPAPVANGTRGPGTTRREDAHPDAQERGAEDRGGSQGSSEAPGLADDPPEGELPGIPSRTVARALLILLLLLLFGAVLSTWWYLSVHDRRHVEPEEGPSLALRGVVPG